MLSFGKNQLVLGVNKIADNIGNVDCVVLLKSELNESLIEPLLLLCKTRGVKVITASYELSIEKLRDITGVKRLAAFAFPKNHCFTLTRYIIDQFMPKSLSKK